MWTGYMVLLGNQDLDLLMWQCTPSPINSDNYRQPIPLFALMSPSQLALSRLNQPQPLENRTFITTPHKWLIPFTISLQKQSLPSMSDDLKP